MADSDIAVVGMACRLPGAPDLDAFWRLLRDGRDARRELDDEQLRALGVPQDVLDDPDFVKAAMLLDGIEQFDAGFFGFSPRDAALFDPQHRVWLEVCWEAFEHAGHVPERFDGRVGVFAGCGMDTYLLHNVLTNPDLVRQVGMFLIRHTGNDKDFLATRTSYQFDLRGPSVNVVTACSTSLVAIHQATQSLLAGECDMALAGGVTILVPQDRGYLYKEGEVLSPDGQCRAFDADSKGTIFGSGAGVVVLRRLADAIADGDSIHAVLAGSAINNDGGRKVSYLAPSVDGYAEVVAEALALAGISAEDVQYVESHGTGTSVGDPIEIEALTQAFRATTQRSGYCGIGSVKTNIGHLDTAAGVAGLLKVVLAMRQGQLPKSLNYRRSNPLIDFPKTPFVVVAEPRDWPRPAGGARIAGVSSLGVGGTNAHVLLREFTEATPASTPYPRRCHLLPISGKSEAAAVANARAMAAWLREQDDACDLADVSWTLQLGRKSFVQRGVAVGASRDELATALEAGDWKAQLKKASDRASSVVFLFPGGGAQYPGMGKELYQHEPVFKATVDECLEALPEQVRAEVQDVLFGAAAKQGDEAAAERMQQPVLLLVTLFVVEYAMARTLQSFGVEADAMLGHSLGEYVAATLGGTWSLEQVLAALVLRGECMAAAPKGAVLSVSLPAAEVQAMAGAIGGDDPLSLSAANAPELCAVAGSPAAIERFEQLLQQRGVDYQRLRIGLGAHSHLLDPVLDRYREGLRRFTLRRAERPWVSNVTGDWIDPQRVAEVDYWVEHLRRTVRFQDGVATLLNGGDRVFVELGPGKALTSLVRMHERAKKSAAVVSLPHPKDQRDADAFALEMVGRLWQHGVTIDWTAFHGGAARRRVPLPTYRFQRQRHWIEPGAVLATDGVPTPDAPTPPTRLPESEWLRAPAWRHQDLPPKVAAVRDATWLLVGEGPLVEVFAGAVRQDGGHATVLMPGAAEGRNGHAFVLPFADAAAWERALEVAGGAPDAGRAPTHLLLAWPLREADASVLVHGMVAMCQALSRRGLLERLSLLAVTERCASVQGEVVQRPGQGAVAGFLRVVPREFPGVRVRSVDVDAAALADPAALVAALRREVETEGHPLTVAWRGAARHVQELVAIDVDAPGGGRPPVWRDRGVYLLSGGLGGIGLLLAEHLATRTEARLVLVSRRGLPPRLHWDEWLDLRHGDPIAERIRRIRAMEAAGAEVEVVAADVTDRAAAERAVRAARQRFGALHGVVHAAGVLDDGPILTRQPARTDRVLRPKIDGARVLDEVTADQPLDAFVVFGSTSGLAGIPGQCDYAAANAALDAFAAWRNGARKGRSLSVDWGLWQDVGMLAERAELSLPAPAWLGERRDDGDLVEFASQWSPATHWQLAEHRVVGGDCVMPGTGTIELMVAAVQEVLGAAQARLADVEFRTPLQFPGDAPRVVTVRVARQRRGYEVTVTSAAVGEHAEHQRTTHARATAQAGADGDRLLDVAACRAAAPTPAEASSDQHRHVAFGPRWQCIEAVHVGDGHALGELRLPAAFAADLEEHRTHAAMLDMAFGCGIRLLSASHPDALFVPVGCEEVVVHGRMPAAVLSDVVVTKRDDHARLGTLDVTVATPGGVVVLELRGLTLFGVRGQFAATAEAAAAPAPEAGRNGHRGAPPPPAPASAPVPRLAAILSRGITGPEGMLGLERALATAAPQVVVSSMDVVRAAAWLSLPPEQPRVVTVSRSADDGDAGEDAPRDDVEHKLVAAFRELLGVERPGLDDDFFELGGHSLLAVRLFARLHQEFGVDLELSTLLGAGSVRKLGDVVRQELGLPDPGDQPVRSVAARKGQHVVPIQTDGTRPNLFLVHGAGGNVLGFRELSHYFGKDQPLYGLQARGVDGKQPPHETIAEMARAYLAEVREVQPHGPFFLGGYSGGGVIAYEMAQLLRSAGEAVAFVGMIDSWCPQLPRRGKVGRAVLHLGRLAKRGPMYPLRILRTKIERWNAARDTERARAEGGPLPQEKRGFEVQFAFENAFVQHTVQPYDGRVWLFRAEDQQHGTRYIVDDQLGWAPFARGGLEVVTCPGNHFTMCTEPNVQVLCRQMMSAIDAVIGAPAKG
ncbi:MAG: SDR family NAD(P)-dependent oxidoreductase [Planctomycetes bacterium]|nr:SDR family NAD(P)-dependent oxidoreductase [Planctomycetota bacterium]